MKSLPSAQELIAQVEAYFAAADQCDVRGTLATMAPDCVLEYLTEGLRFEGRDTAVKGYFVERAAKVVRSWHGDFTHTADAASGRVATRFAVRRTDRGLAERASDNINLFQFEGSQIRRISVWKSSE
jgi:ketosteroid isomerase-like protein